MCTCNHAVTRDSFGTLLSIWINSICLFIINLVLSWYNRNWYLNFGHCCLINDLGSSPQPSGFALGLWWASQVVDETTMTSILVSIPITNDNSTLFLVMAFIKQQAITLTQVGPDLCHHMASPGPNEFNCVLTQNALMRLLNVDCNNHSMTKMPVKQFCKIWINQYHVTYDLWKQKKAKQCKTYFMGDVVR